MSTHKTKVDQEKVQLFLEEHFDPHAGNLAFIAGGESSQAFSFSAQDKEYVIRVNRADTSFQKDRYAHEHFATASLPIPKILEIDSLEDQYVAISEKVSGKLMRGLSTDEYQSVLPDFLAKLDAVHATDISSTSGFGKWKAEGNGEYATWREFIHSLDTYKNNFKEKEVWEKVFGRITELLEYCPEERQLIHADYGYDNVLFEGDTITGVIDWGESKYGDPLYDVAWISFWATDTSPFVTFAELFKTRRQDNGINYQNFSERIRCYELFIGLLSISFYAYSQQFEKYESIKERVLALV